MRTVSISTHLFKERWPSQCAFASLMALLPATLRFPDGASVAMIRCRRRGVEEQTRQPAAPEIGSQPDKNPFCLSRCLVSPEDKQGTVAITSAIY